MTHAEDRMPEPPRCEACGRFKEKQLELERLVVYSCCTGDATRFKPEFRRPDNPGRAGC